MDNLVITKNLLDFCDLELIFNVTAIEKLKIKGGGTSVSSENTVTSFIRYSKWLPPILRIVLKSLIPL